eukprot:2957091-Alexandrium_andersonii.AAC.1
MVRRSCVPGSRPRLVRPSRPRRRFAHLAFGYLGCCGLGRGCWGVVRPACRMEAAARARPPLPIRA